MKSRREAGRLRAIDQRVGRAHGAQIPDQPEHRVVAHRQRLDIGDRQRKAGALQQGAGVADIGERRDARAGAAIELGLGGDQAFAQLGKRAAAGHGAEKQPVGPQRAPDLDQRARNVVGLVQRQQRHGEVEAFGLERDMVEAADAAIVAAEQGSVGLDAQHRSGLAARQHCVACGAGQAEQGCGLVETPLDGRQPFAEIVDGAIEQERRAGHGGGQRAALAGDQEFAVEDRLQARLPFGAKTACGRLLPRYAQRHGH